MRTETVLTHGSSFESQLRDSDLGTQHDAYHKFSVYFKPVQFKGTEKINLVNVHEASCPTEK